MAVATGTLALGAGTVLALGAAQQVQAGRVHQHAGALALDDQVVRLRRAVVEHEAVLKAAAPAGQHADAQRRGLAGRGHDLGDALGRAVAHGEGFAHARNIGRRSPALKGGEGGATARRVCPWHPTPSAPSGDVDGSTPSRKPPRAARGSATATA